jgi:hypothetical protein
MANARFWFVCLAALLPAAATRADFIYGVTGAGNNASSLYTLNGATGQATLINAVTIGGNAAQISGISYNPTDGKIYGTTSASVSFASPNTLVTINPTSGAATTIGSYSGASFQGISFSASGVLYGFSKSGTPAEALYTINTSNGNTTLVGGTGIAFSSSGNGLAVSPTNVIYHAPGGASGQTNAKLFTLSSANGTATAGPAFTGAPLASSQIKGMGFDSGGTLYALNFAPGSPFAANLVTIDPTTAAITNIGATTNGMNALAFAAVPEPSPALLTAIPLALAFFAWRRRPPCQIQTA